MQYKNTLEAIEVNLEELKDLISLMNQNESMSGIDVDLALSKLRSMYDMFLLIKKDLPDIAKTLISEKTDVSPGEKIKKEIKTEEIKHTEEPIDVEPEKIKTDKTATSETVQDKYKTNGGSLNEKLGQKYQDLSTRIKSYPIKSIKDSIGLNEKFVFTNDLFNGDKQLYSNTLTILDNSANFNEAYNYLIENFRWDMDSETVQELLELIRRKYITSKNES